MYKSKYVFESFPPVTKPPSDPTYQTYTLNLLKSSKKICLSDYVKASCDEFRMVNVKSVCLVSGADSLFNKHTANLSLIRAGANHIVARYVFIYRIISTSSLRLPFLTRQHKYVSF